MYFSSKKELAQALLNGRRFKTDNGTLIYFDENRDIPFTCPVSYMRNTWDVSNSLTELKHWYDNIPEQGVLCWVWNGTNTAHIRAVTGYHTEDSIQTFTAPQGCWSHAKPLTKREALALLASDQEY